MKKVKHPVRIGRKLKVVNPQNRLSHGLHEGTIVIVRRVDDDDDTYEVDVHIANHKGDEELAGMWVDWTDLGPL